MARRATVLQEIEALPEADRLDEFPHPRETDELYGHRGAETELATAFASGRMHHAWLLTGREGIGKATLAYRFARYALAQDGERSGGGTSLEVTPGSTAARQVRALSHPRLLLLRRPYDMKNKRFLSAIPVDEVRRLRAFLGHTADRDGWRVVIVDTMDELNANGANALLKSIEEPPSRTVFMLLSSEPGRLLPTIRSRCRKLALIPLAAADLRPAAEQALVAAAQDLPANEEWPVLERLGQGSVRRVLGMAAGEGLALHKRVEGLFAALPRVDWVAAHMLADQLCQPQADQRFELFFELLLDRLAMSVRTRSTPWDSARDGAPGGRPIAEESLATWAELWETLGAKKAEAMTLNLDRRTLILTTLARLEAVSRRAVAS